VLQATIVTTIEPGQTFYRAAAYHQDFLAINPGHPPVSNFARLRGGRYCRSRSFHSARSLCPREHSRKLRVRAKRVLSSTPETGYEEPVADRESIGPGGTMVGESPRLGAFRVYGGYSWT
jgi:hypothetical protein